MGRGGDSPAAGAFPYTGDELVKTQEVEPVGASGGVFSMSQSRLIAGLALVAALLLSLGWAGGALPGALVAAALLAAILLGGGAVARRAEARRFAGPEATSRTEPTLLRIAAELSRQAGLPKPRLYITESDQMNACSAGNGGEACIAISSALLRRLRPEEVAAVLAHELAHVRAKDSRRLASSAVALGFGGLAVGLTALSLAAPDEGFLSALLLLPIFLAAAWAQMALCRAREYRADAVAAALCGHPHWIAAALDRVPDGTDGRPAFSSHPPVRDRITRLHAMAGQWL